jgi:hypothetical protein
MAEGIGVAIPAGQRFFKGDMVYAKYHEDGKWYLAQVVTSDGARGGRVLFVEYGNEQTCSGEELQRVVDAPSQDAKRSEKAAEKAAPPAAAAKAKVVEPLKDFVLEDMEMDTRALLAAVESIGSVASVPRGSGAKPLPKADSSSEEQVKEPPIPARPAPVVAAAAAKVSAAKPPVKGPPPKAQPAREASDSGEEDSA